MTDVTLLTAHPLEESFNATLADAWARGATRAGATVHRFDATRLEFDPVLRKKNMTPADDEPDLARVRAAVDRSRHVTLLFPTWWVGLPGPLKALIDRLLLPGWAYRYEGRALPTGLMAGKSARYVTTMDSPRPWYWLAQHDAFAGTLGRGTLSYVGFSPVKATLVFSARTLDARGREKWASKLARLGETDVLALTPTLSPGGEGERRRRPTS